MAKSISATNIVYIGLLLSGEKIDITLEELIEKVAEYQMEYNLVIGVDQQDFASAIAILVFLELGLLELFDLKAFNKLTFREIIPGILNFKEVYFNDEGEYWIKEIEPPDTSKGQFFD
jgi:hypothetical protein